MENFNIEKYLHANTKTIKDYVLIIRNNLKYLFIISLIALIISVIYIMMAKDIYVCQATIRITRPTENVLEDTRQAYDPGFIDRFIANEIITITDYSIREKIAVTLIDSFQNTKDKSLFYLVRLEENKAGNGHKSVEELAHLLAGAISAEQSEKTDMVRISAESPSPLETSIIANTCAIEYQQFNLAMNREKLTNIRKFLEKQREDKLDELQEAEDTLTKFQEKGGIVALDFQSTGTVSQLAQLDAQKEVTRMELMTSNEVLKQYKYFLNNKDPQLTNFLENQTSQAYITALQQQLAEIQVNRDLVLSIKSPGVDITSKVKEYDQRINELQENLKKAISSIKADAFSGNPEQVQELAQKLIEEEIKNNTLSVKLNQLESLTKKYEGNLRKLPETSTKLSQLQRNRETLQQLYLLINERYQEAMINELSQPGNVVIISGGGIPGSPVKPNRKLILLLGIILGPIIGLCFIVIKDHFQDNIKSPDDIIKKNINFLSWIPQYKSNDISEGTTPELISYYNQDSPISESFRAIRARIQYSRRHAPSTKIILVTSPAEQEGKTFVSVNLAGSYAQADKKTLIIDCDLRRPRIQSIMRVDKKPGLTDYLSGKVILEDVIRKTKVPNLSYITSGTIPPNAAEVLESKEMKSFLLEIRSLFEVVILDSPPIIAVIDAEILAKMADGTVLVVSAEKTISRLLKDAMELIRKDKALFLGTVLNNFKYRSGYGYYYKYYYNYSKKSNKRGWHRSKVKL